MEAVAQELADGTVLPVQIVAFRLFGAVLLCACIGLEREWTQHPAGLRTHMLVGLATALFALLMLAIIASFEGRVDNVELDPMRLLQAVGAAVAFLAAGVVVFAKGEVRGLTTGAGIWVAAGIGLAAGLGFWVMAAITAGLALVINLLLKPVDRRLSGE